MESGRQSRCGALNWYRSMKGLSPSRWDSQSMQSSSMTCVLWRRYSVTVSVPFTQKTGLK